MDDLESQVICRFIIDDLNLLTRYCFLAACFYKVKIVLRKKCTQLVK